MIRRLFALLIPAATFGAIAAPAFADTWSSYQAVQCRDDAVAIRNGGQMNEDPPVLYPLPARYDAHWKNVPISEDKRCKLASGETVVVRFGWGRSYVTGAGGLAPPAWVSVWIDGKKVLSRQIVQSGYAQAFAGPFLNSLFVTPTTIERCAYRDGVIVPSGEDPAAVVCTSTPLDLAATPLDPLEPSPDIAAGSNFTIAATYNPDFCKRFLGRFGDTNPKLAEPYASTETIRPPAGATYPFPRDAAEHVEDSITEVAKLDYWNEGQQRTGVRVWLQDGTYRTANYIFFFSRGEPDAAAITAFTEAVEKARPRHISEFDATAFIRLGWSTPLTDTSSIRLFQLDGQTFFLTQGQDPSEPILLVRPGRDDYGPNPAETVCYFQPRKANY